MKKILSIALALCMMLSVCVVSVGATDGTTVDFVMGDAVVETGTTTFTVELSVTNNPGFCLGVIYFDYDTSAMTLTKIAQAAGTGFTLSPVYGADTNAGVDCDAFVLFDGADDWWGTGTFLTLTFTLNEGITGTFPVTAYIDDWANPLWSYYTDDMLAPYTINGNTASEEGVTTGTGYITVGSAAPEVTITDYNVTLGENFAINVLYEATEEVEISVTAADGSAVAFTAADGKVTIQDISAKNVDMEYTVTVGDQSTTISIKGYCEYVGATSDNEELLAVADSITTYGQAAKNYFDMDNADHGALTVETYVPTNTEKVVSNTGDVQFLGANVVFGDEVELLFRMANYNREQMYVNGTLVAEEVALGSLSTDGTYVYFSLVVKPGQFSQFFTVRAGSIEPGTPIPEDSEDYDDRYPPEENVYAGSSTITYSVDAYIAAMQAKYAGQTSAKALATLNLVNALGNYGAAASTYATNS